VGLETREALQTIALILAVDVVVGGFALAYPPSRLAVGGIMMALGGILVIAGTVGISRVARDEGYLYGLFCKMVPLYKVYYLWTRWKLVREHFTFYAVGMMLLFPGSLLYVLSSDAQRSKRPAAEAREDPSGSPSPRPGLPIRARPDADE